MVTPRWGRAGCPILPRVVLPQRIRLPDPCQLDLWHGLDRGRGRNAGRGHEGVGRSVGEQVLEWPIVRGCRHRVRIPTGALRPEVFLAVADAAAKRAAVWSERVTSTSFAFAAGAAFAFRRPLALEEGGVVVGVRHIRKILKASTSFPLGFAGPFTVIIANIQNNLSLGYLPLSTVLSVNKVCT